MNKRMLQREVPFDQYSRQYQVMTVVNGLRAKGQKFAVLDVGGYKGRTADFLSDDAVTVLDLFDVQEPGYIKGSALEMPFESKSFDFVMSFDVLEHIPAAKRRVFMQECSRVAKRGVIVSAPHKTTANQRAEHILNGLYIRLHGKPHRWLKEHIEYVIPDFKKVESQAKELGLYSTALCSNKLTLWVAMQQPIFINSKYPLAAEKLLEINEYYNRSLEYDGGESPDDSYRKILYCFSDSADRDHVAQHASEINHRIESASEIELLDKIQDYYATLAQKMATSADDYQGLYQHEKNRATELEANSQELWVRINSQDQHIRRLERLHPRMALRKMGRLMRGQNHK